MNRPAPLYAPILALTVLLLSPILAAVPATAEEADVVPTDPGVTCVTPAFEFHWIGHRSAVIFATAAKPMRYELHIEPQPSMVDRSRQHLRDAWEEARKAQDKARTARTAQEEDSQGESPVMQTETLYDRVPRGCWPDIDGKSEKEVQEAIDSYVPSTNVTVDATPTGSEAGVNLLCFLDLLTAPDVRVEYKTLTANVPAVCQKGSVAAVPVFDKHLVRFDVGTVFSLNDESSFDSSAELAVSFNSKWNRWFSTAVDLRFSELGKLDNESMASEESPTDSQVDGMEDDGASTSEDFSPFLQGGSFLRTNAYFVIHPWPQRPDVGGNRVARSFAVIAGAGLSTIPGSKQGSADAKARLFLGARLQAFGFNRGRPGTGLGDSNGFFQFGYAYDKLWKYEGTVEMEVDGETVIETTVRDEEDRFFAEGELEIPRLGTRGVRFVIRAYADLPVSGDGPADVRISGLVGIKPDQLMGVFGR